MKAKDDSESTTVSTSFFAGKAIVGLAMGVASAFRSLVRRRNKRRMDALDRNRLVSGLDDFRDTAAAMLYHQFRTGDFPTLRHFGSILLRDDGWVGALSSIERSRVLNIVAVAYLRTAGLTDDATLDEDFATAEHHLDQASSESLPAKIRLSVLANRQALAIRRGNLGEADQLVRQSLALDARDEDALVNAVCIASLRKDEHQAIARLRELVEHHPQFAGPNSSLNIDPDVAWIRERPSFSTIVSSKTSVPNPVVAGLLSGAAALLAVLLVTVWSFSPGIAHLALTLAAQTSG